MNQNNVTSRFMTVRQIAEYLQLNEKNICAGAKKLGGNDYEETGKLICGGDN